MSLFCFLDLGTTSCVSVFWHRSLFCCFYVFSLSCCRRKRIINRSLWTFQYHPVCASITMKKTQSVRFFWIYFPWCFYEPPWPNVHKRSSLLLFLSIYCSLLLFNFTELLSSWKSLSFPVLSTSSSIFQAIESGVSGKEGWLNHKTTLLNFQGQPTPQKVWESDKTVVLISWELHSFPLEQSKITRDQHNASVI